MGANPADTQREITRLRGDMTAAIDEVQRRVRGGFSGVASSEARISTARAAENNPTLLGVAGVVVVGAVAYGAYALVRGTRQRNKPRERLKQGVEELSERVTEGVERAKRELERSLPQGILLKLEPEDGGYMRVSDARLEPPKKKRGQSTVIKKLVWGVLLSIFMAVGSVMARRVADTVWRAMVHEEPPTEKSKSTS
jgi:hypothetical protein